MPTGGSDAQGLIGLAVIVVPLLWWTWRSVSSLRGHSLTRDEVQMLLGRFELAQTPLLPSHWIAWGLRASA